MENADIGAGRLVSDKDLLAVTILNCDIVNSTRIWSRLDPEDLLALREQFENMVHAVASRHCGNVESIEGDGALIVFGFPDAREDAPVSAGRAGLELIASVRTLKVADVDLELRVGISSGLVAVHRRSSVRAGMVYNLAQRLASVAEPGWVVISDDTHALTANFFEYDDLGTVHPKNYERAVRAWRVVHETSVASRFEAQRSGRSHGDLVGRVAELATLADCWRDARSGNGRVVCLVGDAGMGKSRLAREIMTRASSDAVQLLEIDCMPSTSNSPLYPVGVLLRKLANIHSAAADSDKRAAARQLLAGVLGEDLVADALGYLAPLFGLKSIPIPGAENPGSVQEGTIDTIAKMFLALGSQGPVAVLCEDVHWIDDTTLSVIQRVAEHIGNLPILLILTARTLADNGLLLDRLQGFYKEIRLDPLSHSSAGDLVRAVAKDAPLSQAEIQSIVGRCEGVPLLLEEITRAAMEGTGRADAHGTAPDSGAVPAALQLVVASRLERWREHKPLLQAAAVLGREFPIRLLRQVVPDRADEVEGTIRQLAEHGFFSVPQATSRVRFSHAMIRDAVYQTLLRDDRRRLNSNVADILRRHYADSPDAAPDVVAHYLVEAARFSEAIALRLDASIATAARGAYVEMEGHCRAALAVVSKVADVRERRSLHFRLLVQLGQALTGRHGYSAPQVESAYREARAVCGDTEEAAELYQALRGLTALLLVRGDLKKGYDLSLQSTEIADRSENVAFRIDAMSVHCYATMYYSSPEECRSWIAKCLQLYEQSDGHLLKYPVPNDAGLAALAILPTIEWLLGDSQAAEAAILRGLDLVDRLDQDFSRAYLHAWIAGTRFTQRRYEDSLEQAKIAVAIAGKNGFEEWYVVGDLISLLAEASLRPSPEKLSRALETCKALAAKGVGLNGSWYLWGIALGYRLLGADQVAQQLVAAAFQRAEASGETRMHPELLILQAELESDAAVATELLMQALAISDKQGAVANSLRSAVHCTLRSGAEPAAIELARATKEVLEGRAPYPPERNWMRERLTLLRRAWTTSPVALGPQ